MKCIHCGKNVDDEARFCKYCGTRLRRTCAKCGAGLDEDARFCAACGAEALAELDLTNPLADLSAADKIAATGQPNPLGFYFSRRISRGTRGGVDNCFAICGGALAFMEEQTLNRLTPSADGFVRRTSDVSHDNTVMALALHPDGSICAAGLDWAGGNAPTVTLWQYDVALNLRAITEVLRLRDGAERQTVRLRLTDRHLFIFLWDAHDVGKREIIKYCLDGNGKLEQKQLGGKRIDLWYVDGEQIYFRGERGAETFFGVLDTSAETWTIRRLWTIGNGPDEVPDAPVYCDFARGIAWTAATANERREHGLAENACVARTLGQGYALAGNQPTWLLPESGAVNLLFDYFDGERAYKATTALTIEGFDQAAGAHRWKNTLHGDTENVILWGEQLLADFTSHGYRIYPATLDGPADVYQDGIPVREQ